MKKIDNHKKPAPPSGPLDWSPHYVIYCLRERGTTLRRIARQHGYAPGSGQQVFQQPWPAMQKCIADALGVEPREIWPSRYNEDGTPKPRPVVLQIIAKAKHNTAAGRVNVNRRRAA